ncbi:hypothetical protein CU098_000884, partial [Rhizopus stolonifer]
MYSHHHYSYDNTPRGSANAHSLGRPASMPSLYHTLASPSSATSNEHNKSQHRASLDGSVYHASIANASNWQEINHSTSWNHNHPQESTPPSSLNTAPATNSVYNYNSNSNNNYHHASSNNSNNSSNNNSYLYNTNSASVPQPRHNLVARPKLTTTLWEDEGTICYQVDANGICVARRQDNDMINGTKLLNVAGMSRGKRDGILKNEKGRVVVKVGAMHLKGVWITFARAKLLAAQYKIQEVLYPLFVDDPGVFLYSTTLHNPTNRISSYRSSFGNSWDRHSTHLNENPCSQQQSNYRNAGFQNSLLNHNNEDMFLLPSQVDYNHKGGLVGYGHSSNYTDQKSRIYFSEELLEKETNDTHLFSTKTLLPGTATLSSPTSSEAGKSSAFHVSPSRQSGEFEPSNNEKRQSLVMSTPPKMTSPRHHPYMSPGKGLSIMSSMQSFRSTNDAEYNAQND